MASSSKSPLSDSQQDQGLSCKLEDQPHAMIVVFGGRTQGEWLRSVEGFNVSTNTWSSLCDMPDEMSFFGAAVVGGKVYAVGGLERGHFSRNWVNMYDPSVDTWTTRRILDGDVWTDAIPSMQSERFRHGVAVLNDRIYAIGGFNDKAADERLNELNTAEVLDLTDGGTKEWRNISNMITGRRDVAVGVLNGRIFAVGGQHDRKSLTTVESYDPERNVWSPVADLSEPRSGAGVAVLDGFMYCVGGFNENVYTNSVEKYNEDTNTWSQVAEMNHRRYDHGVVTHAGRLYVIGGNDNSNYLSSVEMYDPSTNTWTLLADMSVGRIGAAVALIHTSKAE